jgi:hypothetical protein
VKHAGRLVLLLVVCLAPGCRLGKGIAELPGRTAHTVTGSKKKKQDAPDPVLLQQRLMRFTDDYTGGLVAAMDQWAASTNAPNAIDLHRLRLNTVSSTVSVATGPNPLINLLDMFVMVTLTRAMIEDDWVAGAAGEFARPMLEACRRGETNITKLATAVLKPEQLDELRRAISRWRQEHPTASAAISARALGFVAAMDKVQPATQSGDSSIFGLLMVDPMAGLAPAARELAQSRLFAERALFLLHRMPLLLRWQTELLVLETGQLPIVQELRTNTLRTASALERASQVIQDVPSLIRSEREQLLKALPSQESTLTNVAAHLAATLGAGQEMTDSLNTTLQSFGDLQRRMAREAPPNSGRTNEPFRIQDYTEAVKQVDAAAQRLTQLLGAVDQTLGSTNVAQTGAASRAFVDYVFRKAVLLIVLVFVLALATALALRRARGRPNSPQNVPGQRS